MRTILLTSWVDWRLSRISGQKKGLGKFWLEFERGVNKPDQSEDYSHNSLELVTVPCKPVVEADLEGGNRCRFGS